MAGEKREKLKLEDTNMALIGSDLDKRVRQANAEHEPAWATCGKTAGEVRVWRIEKFRVVAWPEKQYGEFYDGDSYIVLHTTKKKDGSDALQWDIFFWLGTYTSVDEAGTAAIKSVELDDFFGGLPVQHRELQGQESTAFLALFNNSITILNGGIESGFTHVDHAALAKRDPRLFHVAGPTMRTVRVSQLPSVSASLLAEGDAFVLDDGSKTLYVFRGKTCSPGEISKAGLFASKLGEQIGGAVKTVNVDSSDAPGAFWEALGGKPEGDLPAEFDDSLVTLKPSAEAAAAEKNQPHATLFQVADSGETEQVAEGDAVKQAAISPSGCYVLLAPAPGGAMCWVGADAKTELRRGALNAAYRRIAACGRPVTTALTKVVQGREPEQWTRFAPTVAAAA